MKSTLLLKRIVVLLMTVSIVAFIPTFSVSAGEIPPKESAQEAVEIVPMAVIIRTLHATTAFSHPNTTVGLAMIQIGTPVSFLGNIQNGRALVVPHQGVLSGNQIWICRTAIGR